MIRRVFVSFALVLSATVNLLASDPVVSQEGTRYTLSWNGLSMTVDANQGGKILSFKYNDVEILSQSTFRESFGSTFWTSPQKEWNWPPVPEYDKMPYTVVVDKVSFTMTSRVAERLGFSIRKQFAVDEKKRAFVVSYSIVNEAQEAKKVAPWEITRVANEGLVFFAANKEDITPTGLMDFTSDRGMVWYVLDAAEQNRKVNADGKGWLAYAAKGLLLVKRFQDLVPEQPAPGEAEVQVYVNRGKTYVELESQGAYTLLQPGEELNWKVWWSLVPYKGPEGDHKKLANTLKTLDKRLIP